LDSSHVEYINAYILLFMKAERYKLEPENDDLIMLISS